MARTRSGLLLLLVACACPIDSAFQPPLAPSHATAARGATTVCSATNTPSDARRVVSRRTVAGASGGVLLGLLFGRPLASQALEWVPPSPEEGDCADCIGIKDGFLAGCPNTPTCVSSQDDQGPKADWSNAYAEPWVFEGKPSQAILKIKMQAQRLGGKVIREQEGTELGGQYLRVEFREQGLPGQVDNFDDSEFFITPNDSTVQFRSARRPNKASSSFLGDYGANKKRMEKMRIGLGWEKVPVLRNRKRALVFFESPFDTFGPACNGVSCGEELEGTSTGELNKAQRFDVDPLAAPALPVKLAK